MSKFFANVFMKEYEYDVEVVRRVIKKFPVKIRYTNYNQSYHISCLNLYRYIKSGQQVIEPDDFVVFEPDLIKMINFDVLLTDITRKELGEASKFIKDVEMDNTDLAINQYWAICFIQRYFTLTKNTLKEIKKQRHLWKLGREKSPYYTLIPVPANRHGGRTLGSLNKMPEEERERLLYNLSVYDSMVHKCVASDNFEKFFEFHMELRKLPKKDLPELLKRNFMNKKRGILWYFYALRYEYKINEGVPSNVINPGIDEIAERAQELDFPFKYIDQGKNMSEIIFNYDNLAREYMEKGDLESFVGLHLAIRNYSKAPQRFKFIEKGGRPLVELLFHIMRCDYLSAVLCNEDAIKALIYYCSIDNPIFSKYIDLLSPDLKEEVRTKKAEHQKRVNRRKNKHK